MASEKSKILIIGGTGYIGKFLVTASVRLGHLTYALVRDISPSDPVKAKTLQNFKDSGLILLQVRACQLPNYFIQFCKIFFLELIECFIWFAWYLFLAFCADM